MYDFDFHGIMDAREFFDFNKDNSLKRDRTILYFATGKWDIESVWTSLQYIQNRPTYNYDEVRATILTWWWFHPKEVRDIQIEMLNSRADQPLVVLRIISLERSQALIERKYKS